jgi:hypothetical protein
MMGARAAAHAGDQDGQHENRSGSNKRYLLA